MPARLRALLVVLCAAVLGALLPAAGAHAASRTVQGGRLDWGIKSSFQSYVTGPVANGSYSLTGGAATVGASGFRFHSATGTYDAATGAFRASFAGGVHFVGHRAADGTYRLDLTLSRPSVRITGSTGTLYLDVTSKAKGTGTVTTSSQVPFASLALGGIDMRGAGTSVALAGVPATLTSQGARSFAGYYTAGTALDPVSLAVDVRPAKQTPDPRTPTPTPSRTKQAAKKERAGDAIEDGAVDWGVRRTYREYVTGDIANGRWTLSAGARDGGALFRFPAGEGTYREGALTARFAGAVRFTGDRGLDLELSGLRAVVGHGVGTLYADVAGPDLTREKVPLVTFTAKGLKDDHGLVALTEAPARLTAEGARAFGGMYPAGTVMDPVSLAVTLTDDAELPALPDLGDTAGDTASAVPAPVPTGAPKTSPEPVASATAEGHGGTAPTVALTAAALLLAAALFTAARRRARRPRTATVGTPAEAVTGTSADTSADAPAETPAEGRT
ncbi:HtaA domain-containing protein [Streptomyces sp. NPDC059378]|uniref:HtaA domain-containing protein n=1 Tax=Streptomyces sp. NPDC059378 TaxID=3346815 RepID=UPI0036873D81